MSGKKKNTGAGSRGSRNNDKNMRDREDSAKSSRTRTERSERDKIRERLSESGTHRRVDTSRNAGSGNKGRSRQNVESQATRTHRKKKPNFFKIATIGVRQLFSSIGHILSGKKLPINIIAFFAVAIVLIITVLAFTNKNAYEVKVDGIFIGSIQKNKNITAEDLYNTAVTKLAADAGTKVQVAEKVSIAPVHSNKKDILTVDYIVDAICKVVTYKLEAAIIEVEGTEIAIVKNMAEAQDILDRLAAEYIGENAKLVEKGFVETVNITTRYVDSEEIIKSELAFSRLSVTKETEQIYYVKDGDSLWGICSDNRITINQLLAMNPDLTIDTVLKIGQNIVLILPTPLLSVRTVEEVKYIEVAPKTVETITNSTKSKTYSRVVQQGKDGQQEVTAHIVRINGFEKEKIIVDTVITVPPEKEIIEKGTK